MSQDVKWWSVVVEGADFKDTRELVYAFLSGIYIEFGQERVVSSTVFYPLRDYADPGLDYKMLQVWVTPRHGDRVIVKVTIKGETSDLDYERQVDRAFDKIVSSLREALGRGKVNII